MVRKCVVPTGSIWTARSLQLFLLFIGEITGGFFPIQIVPKKAAEQKEEAAAQPSNKVKIPPLIYFAASAVAAGSALYECSRPSMEIKNQVLYPSLFVSTLLSLFVDNFIPR
jgi:hypothetical protein